MSHLTETIEYTPRNDWGALPWGSVDRMAWSSPERAEARKVADWIVGKGPSDLMLLDGKVLLRGQVRIPDPVGDVWAAMSRVRMATGHTPNVLYIGGKRLVDPTLERGIMALTGCTAAEAEAHVRAFWAETRAGQSGMGKEG